MQQVFGMTFDPTITFGAILIVMGQFVSVLWFAARMDKRVDMLSMKTDNIDERVDALAATIKEYAATGERFAKAEGRIESVERMTSVTQAEVSDLRRGRGWIGKNENLRPGIDGQYG